MPKLLGVFAHPDDDTFGVGRTVALHRDDPALEFVLVIATDGEAGEIAPDSGVERTQLGTARRREDEESWRVLGRTPDRTIWLGLPDGGLTDLPPGRLQAAVGPILERERPDVVVTFGPDGITGHPDHVAIGAATTHAFTAAIESGTSMGRLLHGAIPLSWIDRWNTKLRAAGEAEWDPQLPFHLRGVPDETIGIDVDTATVVDRVVAAVRAHRTQWSYLTVDDDLPLARSSVREHWVVAWPPSPPGSPVLGDVFEGLA
jgi:LmbE family N-acetylglucosaminyl deacetylase